MDNFELVVGNWYYVHAGLKNEDGAVVTPKIQIVAKKANKTSKATFLGSNGLEYNPNGHVVGFLQHMYDLTPRVKDA